MRIPQFIFVLAGGLLVYFLSIVMNRNVYAGNPANLPIIQNWQGDYLISALNRLPEGMRYSNVGYIDDGKDLSSVWEVFKPGEIMPEVDFDKNFVIFARNTAFYNRLNIASILLREGAAEILIRQTLTSFPIEEKVYMALAVIPKAGIKAINTGNELIPVGEPDPYPADNGMNPIISASKTLTSDTLNVACIIEGQEIFLKNGRSEVSVSRDSATKIRTWVSGDLVFGDIDDDGEEDAVFVLVQDPGGSGTFYYVASAVNRNGQFVGTNAVWIGDRIVSKNLQIRNSLVVAEFARRKEGEPMSSPPGKKSNAYLIFEAGSLKKMAPREEGEQIFDGWVTIGHEVRSFQSCFQNTDYWIAGDSPAMNEIMTKYRSIFRDVNSYEPLFAVIVGKIVEPPREGFGADYETAIYATQLIRISTTGECLDRVIK